MSDAALYHVIRWSVEKKDISRLCKDLDSAQMMAKSQTGMRLQPHVGGGVCRAERNGKKVGQRCAGGTFCLLTRAF